MDSFLISVGIDAYAVSAACFFFGRGSARRRLVSLGMVLLGLGAAFNALDLIVRGIAAGNLPVASFGESLSFFALLTAATALIVMVRMRVSVIGILVAPLVTVALSAAYITTQHGRLTLPDSLRSGWLPVHVTLAFLGYALFVLAAGVSVVYLTYEFRLKSKRPVGAGGERVPSLEKLDRINYGLLGWGFVMLSLAILSGAIWADATWGHFWSWEPQETWSLATWILYAALLESRLTVGWRGRRAATLTIVIFTVLAGSFLGVSLMHQGRHGGNFD